ncbi:hypothetical protein THRCLA_03218 [Thraustotheca clavata]|uniref:Uncharacterized protein n=1 Tax=Thraustotheca clavata TaxID=74557 RepID=A0A1W0A2Y6_9STRA|nr:hypothetical protein THRCLA_03218 [Thraustotheca clavata]
MSAYLPGVVTIPNPLEIPYSLNMYINAWLQYITGIICLVAILAVINSIASRGNVEGINMFNLNRMAGTVWVGRPLLVLRGVAAICLLSTSSLELVQNGKASMFVTKTLPWYQAVLASGEVGWIIYVYNDMMTIFTSQYTYHTALASSLLMWLIAALFAFLSPVSHSASVSRDCFAVEMDFDINCLSGVVAIGSVRRFWLMLIIAAVCTILCFLVFRLTYRNLKLPISRSLLLSSTARYVYELNGWVYDEIYHLDRMSAVLNGLIVFSRNSVFYALDIKSWRFVMIPVSTTCPKKFEDSLPLTQ